MINAIFPQNEAFPPPPPLFFFRLASNAFPDIGSVDRIEKKNLKELSLGIGGLVPHYHCRGAWKQQVEMAEKLVDVIVELRAVPTN